MTKTCRLCLQSDSEKYFHMDMHDYREKMQSVIPEINIEMVKHPLICIKCSELLLSAYSFKSTCLQIDEELKSYIIDDRTQITLEEFLKQKNQDLLSNVKVETVDINTQDLSLDIDISETEVKESYIESNLYKVIHVDIVQKPNNKCPANIESDVCEIKVSETLVVTKNENKPMDEKIAENSSIQREKIVVNKCPICNKIFLLKSGLEEHLRNHKQKTTQENPKNKCEKCKKVFLRKTNLEAHVCKQQKISINVNKCPICRKIFFRKDTLDRHLTLHSRAQLTNFKCSFCDVITTTKASLDQHLRTHTGERPYHCTACGRSFAQSSTLRTHVRSLHMTERPYVCEICNMGFPVRGAYTAHKKRRHEPVDKKFVCNYCGKAFRIKSILERHIKCHTGQKDYLCKVCSKTFVDNNSLKKHMRMHNGWKPYQCPMCPKTFSQNCNMKAHVISCSQKKSQTVAR